MQHRKGVRDLLGTRDLKGKSFYLDSVRNRHSALLVEAISRLGGKVESFLNKDVSCVISGSQEVWHECQSEEARQGKGGAKAVIASSPVSAHKRDPQNGSKQRAATPRPAMCGSRGKALLEKAIRNNDRCRESSVLANARSWGVKIVHVNDFLWYTDIMTAESAKAKGRRMEKKAGESSAPRIVKAAALKSPYVKIEDCSGKYRPLHLQSMSLPTLDYTGRFSPFEPPAPPPLEREKDPGNIGASVKREDPSTSQEKLPTPLPLTPLPGRARKKTVGYCECCQLAFKDQNEHLKSDQHREFVQDSSHYSVVDQLVALMQPGFIEIPVTDPATMRLPNPEALPLDPSLELDPQVHSDTEKAIQALLTQGSPPQVFLHPGQDTSMELEKEEAASKPPATTGLPSPLEQAEVDPVPLATLTALTPAPCSGAPGQQDCHPEAGAVCDADGECMEQIQEKLPVEGSWPAQVCPQHSEPPEEGRTRSHSPPPTCTAAAQNPRKRSRSFSLSPRAHKRRRTTWQQMSDPTMGFPSISQHRVAPDVSAAHPSHKALPTAVPLRGASHPSEPDASISAELRQEVEMEVDAGPLITTQTQWNPPLYQLSPPPDCNSSLTGCGHTSGVISSVLKEHRGTEPSPRQLAGVESLPIETLHPPGASLPQPSSQIPISPTIPNPISPKDSTGVTNPAIDKAQPFHISQDFSTLPPMLCSTGDLCLPQASQDSNATLSQSHSSIFIEASLLPDPSAYSPSSSDSDWDCGLLSRIVPAVPPPARGEQCLLDLELLQRPCTGMQDGSYESRLCSVLHTPTPPPSLCGEDTELWTPVSRPVLVWDIRCSNDRD